MDKKVGKCIPNLFYKSHNDIFWINNSLPQIAERIRKKVKRNFNQEEWNYYVGKGIPYKKIIDN